MRRCAMALAAFSTFFAAISPCGCKRQAEPAVEISGGKGLDADFREAAHRSIAKGLGFLEKCQVEPGSGDWGDPGISALVMIAFLESPEKPGPSARAFISKGLDKLVSLQKRDGAIYLHGNATYVTSVSLMAFVLSGDQKYTDAIAKARQYLVDSQVFEPGNKYSGGFGYQDRKDKPEGPYADIVNTEFALEALQASGLPRDNPVWIRAVEFLSRCQHQSEYNPVPWADTTGKYTGGFVYHPGESKAGDLTMPDGSKVLLPYGSVTYAGIKSMIYANLLKDDPRVLAAVDWIKKNWTLDVNPGFDVTRDLNQGKQGLFYYYVTFAKALHAMGRDFITDDKGATHDWREELIRTVVALQNEDGSWKNTWHQRWWEGMPPLATCYAVMAMSFALKK